jgi:hypothetical protein
MSHNRYTIGVDFGTDRSEVRHRSASGGHGRHIPRRIR